MPSNGLAPFSEMYVLLLCNLLGTTGGYFYVSVEQVCMGTPVVISRRAGCGCVASPLVGQREDNVTPVAAVEQG